MTIETKESKFEKSIESSLLQNGYIKREPRDFDKNYIIDGELFCKFIQDTQNEKWQKLQEIFGSETQDKILQAYDRELNSESLIHVIRKGFIVSGIKLDCLYLKPVSNLNPEAEILYQKNILSVIRQVRTVLGNKPDIVLCLNGIPVATTELKNPASGQSFEDAITQYKEDRDPKDKLFSFKRGALVHFAVDPHEVHMTTKLQQEKTWFLPFNKGKDEGRGNPLNPSGYETAYLWEKIWLRDTWIEIISNFIELQIVPQKHPIPDKESIIFPRYHQLDAVLNLTHATKEFGAGRNYLIQHSTGSGKSNSIAWLSYKLLSAHSKQDKPIFDGVMVLSDRVGIVNQLGKTIQQFEQTSGTVVAVKSSQDLADNLATQRRIIISTQQKFPFVLDYIKKVKGKNYAVIIDEAHSSQSSESRKKIQEVLTTNLDDAEKQESKIEEGQVDIVDQIEKEMEIRGKQDTLSYYAFTATPKKKTLKLFGTKITDEDYKPFHVYSMKQAIQEGFILDVLKNYTTYDRHFKIVKTASEDKTVEGKKASRALLKYVELHQLNLENKAKVIVEHFKDHTQQKIGEEAKAMVVGSSRLQALKYKLEIDEYIKEKGYKNIKTLVAFSGSLKDDTGKTYTEQSINGTHSDWELREKFDTKEFNILIVAEKYQTGFDQPLLHTMYVDKKLYGIKAVQTLSRLNRTHAGKTDTLVVDFKNNVDEIYASFMPYYQGTSLVDKTNQSYLFNLYTMIMEFEIIKEDDLDKFAETFFKPKSLQVDADLGKLYASVNPILNRFDDILEKSQDDFKTKISKYIEAYAFLTQLVPYDDTNLEKLYVVLKFIINENLIKNAGSEIPEIKGDISLQWYRLEKTHEGGILLGEGRGLRAGDDYGSPKPPEVLTSLSEVIKALNDKFGGTISGADSISIEEWLKELKNDELLRQIAKENSFDDFFRHFEKKFMQVIIESEGSSQALVKRVYDDIAFQKELVIGASQLYHEWVKTNNLPPITPSNPAKNRQIFRQTIHQCKGYVKWLDLYLNEEGIDFMIDSFDHDKVKNIQILTSTLDNHDLQENLRKVSSKFKAYKEEFEKNGIILELKVITSKIGRDKVAHDRYLLGENKKFNAVAFTQLQKGRLSEIFPTPNEIPFDEYWNNSESLDLIQNLDKINVKCDDCGKDTQPPFVPDGKRPVFCHDCFKKNRGKRNFS